MIATLVHKQVWADDETFDILSSSQTLCTVLKHKHSHCNIGLLTSVLIFFTTTDGVDETDTGSSSINVSRSRSKWRLASIAGFLQAFKNHAKAQLCVWAIYPACSSQIPCGRAAAKLSHLFSYTRSTRICIL